ncbi:cytidylyltransferase domain-containing protein [Yunchengibacter salinarum]|uniref:cytidylyltransferase domain-containing protein n=1 Tax=Yunchengibacter salinarum TaxID=3133399 RepID=UPI0035B5A83C
MTTLAIIQTRMGSSRLPGKALMPLAGWSVLHHVVTRAMAIKGVDDVVVATGDSVQDAPIVETCRANGWPVMTGPSADVLGRFAAVVRARRPDVVLRLTGDCPLLDPAIVAALGAAFHSAAVDYGNLVGFPHGIDAEYVTAARLLQADRDCGNPTAREHVTMPVRTMADVTRLAYRLSKNSGGVRARHRWVLDYREDLDFLERVAAHLGADFTHADIAAMAALVRHRPELPAINAFRSRMWQRQTDGDRARAGEGRVVTPLPVTRFHWSPEIFARHFPDMAAPAAKATAHAVN